LPTGTTPALPEGTAGIELAGGARREVNAPPRELELDALPPEDWRKPEALRGRESANRRAGAREPERGQNARLGARRCD